MTAIHPSGRSLALLDTVIRRMKEAGLVTDALIEEKIRVADAGTPLNGARMVVRAWTDPEYRKLLLADGRAGVAAIGYTAPAAAPLGILENTPERHHMVVCTLCSCYPRWLLGYPPHWYKSATYRARAVREPRRLLAEWGLELPPSVQVRVVDSTADYRWMVLPMRPSGTEGWDDERLLALVTPDSLVGAEVCRIPAAPDPAPA